MKEKELVQCGIDALLKAGAQKAVGYLVHSEKQELNIEANRISLFRTTYDVNLAFSGIINQRKGSVAINRTEVSAIEQAAREVIELAQGAPEDPAHDIAERQPAREFVAGPEKPDLDLMYDRFAHFMDFARAEHPALLFDPGVFDFTLSRVQFLNSNGVDFQAQTGKYDFSALFSAKEGKETSSFNYTGFSARELDREIAEYGSVATLLRQTCEQIRPQHLPEGFTGDIIVTPDCLSDFLSYFISTYLSDRPLITGTSIFRDKLNQAVADSRLSIRSCPRSPELAAPDFFTRDGYEAQDFAFVENGVLRNFALSLYGSRKTGKDRAPNDAMALFVDPGSVEFDQLVKQVKRGLLLCRFSGGSPGESGDFSGVAKNSYYIENGEVKFPLKETMISGNLATMFQNIGGISRERINFGNSVLPWIHFPGISISGK
jgi:PmbA protein